MSMTTDQVKDNNTKQLNDMREFMKITQQFQMDMNKINMVHKSRMSAMESMKNAFNQVKA